MAQSADVIIVGAGAAGLMTAITLGRELRRAGTPGRVVLLDGAKKPGAKILVAGGGRCNVTHHVVDQEQYAGTSRNTIRNVLRQFTADDTVAFFQELGVELKREDTGKLFPVTDKAQTVLDALMHACRDAGIELIHPWRVGGVERCGERFVVREEAGDRVMECDRLVLATGGMALPRTGSNGVGYRFCQALGHTLTDRVFPALVPLKLDGESRWLIELSGISTVATLEVRNGQGKRRAAFTNSILCTHFGLSGPGVLDISRYWSDTLHHDPDARLVINWQPDETFDSCDRQLQQLGKRTPLGWLRDRLPERLAKAIIDHAGVNPQTPGHGLGKPYRRTLAHALTGTVVRVAGDRGFTHAEVTAGGVPLKEIAPKTMRSRTCDRLWLVGELLDCDGRVGGFNFQWAWATGAIAGRSIAAAMGEAGERPPAAR